MPKRVFLKNGQSLNKANFKEATSKLDPEAQEKFNADIAKYYFEHAEEFGIEDFNKNNDLKIDESFQSVDSQPQEEVNDSFQSVNSKFQEQLSKDLAKDEMDSSEFIDYTQQELENQNDLSR